MLTGRTNAPEINTRHGWLNTDREWSVKDFRGKIVLLDFWTYGCINCQHILPDLKRLEEEYPQELVVIGVHSAKFAAEKSPDRIRQAILKYGISHPVVNDADFEVWRQYAINAWPTVVLIDPSGKVRGQKPGEGVYEVVKPYVDELVQEFGDTLSRETIPFRREESAASVLRFPGKMISDGQGSLYVSDSGHNRVLKLDGAGNILLSIGSGRQGFGDGSFEETSFHEPQGLALVGPILYIADTRNNAIRKADRETGQVTTVAGDGSLSYYFFEEKIGEPVLPNSPWDLAADADNLYIASAGNHQLLRLDLATEKVYRLAGTGRETLTDGSLREAGFNQPSGLVLHERTLFVADPEASAIRAVDLETGFVRTLVGKGLFEFGDRDGEADDALLQHPLGLTHHDSMLYIADTYNGKIKMLDLHRNRVRTVVAGLEEPNDVRFMDGKLWVTDTNRHQLLRIDLSTGEKEAVAITEAVAG
jgi:thiol-disulfide isomerase/thioredoxin